MDSTEVKKFKGSHEFVWSAVGVGAILVFLGMLQQGFSSNVFKGALIYVGITIFIYIGDLLTYTSITNNETLISKVFLSRSFKANIPTITKIDRTSVFIFRHWGSRLQIHHTDKNGNETWHTIQESMYSVKTIKELIVQLKQLNPSIKLHRHYQDLIDGKMKNEDAFKKMPVGGPFAKRYEDAVYKDE